MEIYFRTRIFISARIMLIRTHKSIVREIMLDTINLATGVLHHVS